MTDRKATDFFVLPKHHENRHEHFYTAQCKKERIACRSKNLMIFNKETCMFCAMNMVSKINSTSVFTRSLVPYSLTLFLHDYKLWEKKK